MCHWVWSLTTSNLRGNPRLEKREAWNADALMEGVRVGTKRSEFLAALEDRVGAEGGAMDPTA